MTHPTRPRITRILALVLASCSLALPSCALLGAGPVDIPRPEPALTLAAGDVLLVLPAEGGTRMAPLFVLTVDPSGTVEVPGGGPLNVSGYTEEDLAAVLLSLRPELGDLRVERRERLVASSR